MRCEQEHYFATILGILPKDVNFSQRRGTHMHNLLYLFYKAKIHKKLFDGCTNAGLRYLRMACRKLKAEDFMLLGRKYSEYVVYYRQENIQPIAVEKGFSKILYEDKDHLFIYEGRIDFIGKFPNDPAKFWVDHKTEARKEELNPDSNQFLGYSWALGTTNGLINYIGFQTGKSPDEAFRRTIVTHHKELIAEWHEQTIHAYFRLANLHRHSYYTKNRSQCKPYACQPCMYHELCHQANPRKVAALISQDFEKRATPWKAWD
jgi:hypothetical protein